MVHSIHDLLPTEGSRVKIYYYYGDDPQQYEEEVIWEEDIQYEYNVTHWKEV